MPGDQSVETVDRLLVGQIGIHRLRRSLVGGRFAKIQRLARDDVDRARRAAFDHVGLLALVDFHIVDDLGRKQIEGNAAAHRLELVENEPVARRDRMTVDHRLRQAGIGAAYRDAVVFVEPAFA